MASVCAASVTHPLETVKTRMQMQDVAKKGAKNIQYGNIFKGFYVIVQNEGFLAIYKGIKASWLRESVYSTLRLGLYEPIKQVIGCTGHNDPFYKKFAAAAASGAIGSFMASPLDLLKLRM